jgi:hypothetical protein
MIDVVVGSLEGFAEEAELDGDAKFAANSHAVACTITDTNLAESSLIGGVTSSTFPPIPSRRDASSAVGPKRS